MAAKKMPRRKSARSAMPPHTFGQAEIAKAVAEAVEEILEDMKWPAEPRITKRAAKEIAKVVERAVLIEFSRRYGAMDD